MIITSNNEEESESDEASLPLCNNQRHIKIKTVWPPNEEKKNKQRK